MVNRTRRVWHVRPALLLLAWAVLAGTPAAAEATVTRGTLAPELDGRALSTNRSVLLAPLRGRMVLLEFFGTDCPHCKRMAPRMNAIHKRYAGRGMAVIGLTPDSRQKAQVFRRAYDVRHGIALAPMDTLRTYGVTEYPLGLLIAPNGRVLWRGRIERLTDRVIAAYMNRVKVLPTAPPAFTLVRDALRHRRFGEAEQSLDRLRSCDGLDSESCQFVLRTLEWIAWHEKVSQRAAAKDEERERWHMAYATYTELEQAYVGTDVGTHASRAKARLLADPNRAAEIRAAAALSQARRLGRWQPKARQVELLRPVAKVHAGTGAGAEAGRLIQLLTKR